jgi:hypothetical protein
MTRPQRFIASCVAFFLGCAISIPVSCLAAAVLFDPPDATTQDILRVTGSFDDQNLYLGALFRAGTLSVNNLTFSFGLDTDRNPATGTNNLNLFLGAEFTVARDALGADPSQARVNKLIFSGGSVTAQPQGSVPVSFGTDSFTLAVPLAFLGGSDGRVNFGLATGTPLSPGRFLPTDKAPDPVDPSGGIPLAGPAKPTASTVFKSAMGTTAFVIGTIGATFAIIALTAPPVAATIAATLGVVAPALTLVGFTAAALARFDPAPVPGGVVDTPTFSALVTETDNFLFLLGNVVGQNQDAFSSTPGLTPDDFNTFQSSIASVRGNLAVIAGLLPDLPPDTLSALDSAVPVAIFGDISGAQRDLALAAVPEPSSLVLLLAAASALSLLSLRKRKRRMVT